MFTRTQTRQIKVKNLTIGGQNQCIIQSMTNTKTRDVEATIAQCQRLMKVGCQIIRVAITCVEDAQAIAEIKKQVEFQLQIKSEIGKPFADVEVYKVPEEIDVAVREYATSMLKEALNNFDRTARSEAQDKVDEDVKAHFAEIFPESERQIGDVGGDIGVFNAL